MRRKMLYEKDDDGDGDDDDDDDDAGGGGGGDNDDGDQVNETTGWMAGNFFRFQAGTRDFSFVESVQTVSGAYQNCNPVGNGGDSHGR